ncbi:unnamed protein product [Arctogadus glacialis]
MRVLLHGLALLWCSEERNQNTGQSDPPQISDKVLPPAAAVVDGNRCVCDTGPLWGPPEALVSYTEALLWLCIQTSVVDAVVLDDVAPRSRSRGRGGGDPGP